MKTKRLLWSIDTSWTDKKGVLHVRRETESGHCETVICPTKRTADVKPRRAAKVKSRKVSRG